ILMLDLTVLPSHRTSNLINQRSSHGPVQLPLRPHLHRVGIGHDSHSGWRWRDASGAIPTTHLLGARRLDRECIYLPGRRVVGFLSLAQSATVELSPLRLRLDLTNDLVSCRTPAFSTRRRD